MNPYYIVLLLHLAPLPFRGGAGERAAPYWKCTLGISISAFS
jgi:hypothetical protein